MSQEVERTGYNVGYGRPPVERQFRAGSSGNPAGRPRKKTNRVGMSLEMAELIRRVASLPVSLQERGQKVSVSMAEAMVRQLCLFGVQGDVKAILEGLDLFSQADNTIQSQIESQRETDTSGLSEGDRARQKLLEFRERRLREMERERQASDPPSPLPDGLAEKLPSPSAATAEEGVRAELGQREADVSAIGATAAREPEANEGHAGNVSYEDPSHEALIMERDAILAEAFAISPVLSPSNDPRYFELIFALNRLNKQLPTHLRKQLDLS